MKVLIVSAANSIHTVRWVNSLSEKGVDITLVHLQNHSQEENKISKKIQVISLKKSGFLGYFTAKRELKEIWKNGKFDLVHAHFASGYGTLVRLARLKPAILSVWGTDIFGFPNKGLIHKRLIKQNLKYYDLLTSTSTIMKSETLKYNSKLDIRVVPFGVDTRVFKKSDFTKNEEIKLVTVKTYLPRYGIEYLIKAIPKVIEKVGPIKLDIYGKGPLKSKYNELIQELNMTDYISVNGYVENNLLPNLLTKYDIAVLPSLEESFGVSAVESMAVGLPVIASDAVGFVEVIEDSVSGIIVPKGNSELLSSAIVELSRNKEKREFISENGIKRVHKLYDWDKNVDEMIRIYKEVLDV